MRVPEEDRVCHGIFATTGRDGNNGLFVLSRSFEALYCFASDGGVWEHVSVTTGGGIRCPTWEEMNYVRDVFWSKHVTVLQFHPPADQYVNTHPFCLHLWRQPGVDVPLPPKEFV